MHRIKIVIIFCFLFFLLVTSALALKSVDVNGDGKVNAQDLSLVISSWFGGSGASDIDDNGKVNSQDLAFVLSKFGQSIATPTVGPTSPPASPSEWTQFGHDAQRTNYTSQTVATPWRLKWQWNASNASGKTQSSHLPIPKGVQPITGGGLVYLAAKNGSSETVYAFNKTNGSIVWQNGSLGRVVTTPAYYNSSLYVTSSNGVYRLNAATGAIQSSMTNLGAFKMSPLLVADKNRLYVANDSGVLYAIDLTSTSWQTAWSYAGGSPAATTPAYSPSTGLIIYATHDLYLHAVREAGGTLAWDAKKKPTNRSPFNSVFSSSDPYWPDTGSSPSGSQASFEYAWPAIAEASGVVFIRARLDWNSAFDRAFPTTNYDIKTYLENNPGNQALFARNLSNGNWAFTPAVGNGGEGDDGRIQMGPMPVIATIDNQQVAYTTWRNALTCTGSSCDAREDTTMGEMVLDSNHTISGCANPSSTSCEAGDVRFVKYEDIQTDEQTALTMSGRTLFHSHWLITAAETIGSDRTSAKGNSFSNPISTQHAPFFLWRQCQPGGCNQCLYPGCSGECLGCNGGCDFNSSHYCGDLYSYGDSRGYPGGFYEYYECDDNLSSIDWPDKPFTVVSDGLVLVLARDGGLMVLENGSPTGSSSTSTKLAKRNNKSVLGIKTPAAPISYQEVKNYLGQQVTVRGKVETAENLRPKAIYLKFKNPNDSDEDNFFVRIFEKDISKFSYDPMSLEGKIVEVTGLVTLYAPAGGWPEIVVTDPGQIKILTNL